MKISERIEHFSALGKRIAVLAENFEQHEFTPLTQKAKNNNAWFTDEAIQFAFSEIALLLQKEQLEKWLSKYSLNEPHEPKTVGLILAGNIPLVGFHDILCVLIAGHKVLAKLSSKDKDLYQLIYQLLIKIHPNYEQRLVFTEVQLKNIDAIIATGSNNSARYFEYYFQKYPNIIRKNRNSIAILSGNETEADFDKLGEDIFTYFGLGCRNVSFLYVPEDYDFVPLLKALEKFSWAADHAKYANNYDYQRAILLMNQIPIYDNGSVILKESYALASPIGVLHYQYYKNPEDVTAFVKQHKNAIQCAVSKTKWTFPTYCFGQAQKPDLWDYADNVDTMEFLLELNN